ncbi:cysteine proteinase inhibitor 1-like [Musa acuminata AAA Group]|uniref:cysteine proteinase inhibitor 1-like n=1 Tax=Musa acuminata AAA Group TaxID=214697 RepID=UPI0031D866DE
MRSLLPLLLCSLLASTVFATSHVLDPPRKGLDGGWTAIEDLKDPHVREIAEFAVSENNKLEKTNLTLRKVEGGETQVVAGTNYRLVLEVRDGSGASARYEAVVWEKPWESFKQLASFHKLVIVGGWTPIKNISDPDVGEIAEFAVAEHNHEAGTNLTLCKVVKGETQVVAGINYKLVIEAKDGGVGVVSEYEAVVWEKTWEHFRRLTSFKLLEAH